MKSSTGRIVGSAGQFVSDAEVIFQPATKFRVMAWYHGDVIALAQANIRQHTFGIKEVDDERAPLAQVELNLDQLTWVDNCFWDSNANTIAPPLFQVLESEKSLIIELEEIA